MSLGVALSWAAQEKNIAIRDTQKERSMISTKQVLFTAVCAAVFSSAAWAEADTGNIDKMIQEGRKVFTSKSLGNCIGCHSVQNDPMSQTGNLGPHLANMDQYPKDYLVGKITNPNMTNPNTIMPPIGRNHRITKEQIQAVVAYLTATAKSKRGE